MKDDQANLVTALNKAEEQGYKNVLFFVLGKEAPLTPEGSSFHQEQLFSNLAHSLVLYSQDH